MKRINYFMHFAVMLLIAISGSTILLACSKDDEPKNSQDLNVYPWVDYPQSYIRLFDYRMGFQMLNVQRNETALQIDYTLTNKGFGEDITITFYLASDAAHDNLGNTYTVTSSQTTSDVIASIGGGIYSLYGQGRQVEFLPNQTIKGSFMIKDFDKDATAFSISVSINPVKPKDLILAANKMDFVNIPVAD